MTTNTIRGLLVSGDRDKGVTIVEVKIDTGDVLESMRDALDARAIDGAGRPMAGHGAWIDDEGMFMLADHGGFLIATRWYAQPLTGPILITGLDEAGHTTTATCQECEVMALIQSVCELRPPAVE